MVAGINRRGGRSASVAGRNGRRVSVVGSALGALVALSAGLAPNGAAADVQTQQWYLSAMKADEVWRVSTGKGVEVAVVDTGVNPNTPSLKGQVLAGDAAQAVSYKATEDYDGHGTSMAELIAGTGAQGGLKGLAPGAKIVPYRLAMKSLKDEREKAKAPELSNVIRAIADSDTKIISMSFGEALKRPDVLAAIKYAHAKGKLMIAAIGNDAEYNNSVEYPAAYPYVVGVAASDRSGKVGKFSAHGNYVDLASPGLDIPTWCDNTFRSYCTGQGTSQATAITSASAALIWSAHPKWTADQVLASLIDTAGRDWAKDNPSTYLGYGLIRPRKVLDKSDFNPGPADTDPLAKENAAGVTGGDPASPAPSVSTSSQPPKNAAESNANASEDKTKLYSILGAVLVAAIGGGVFAVVRRRRTA